MKDVKTGRLMEIMVHRYERYLPTAFDESLTLLEKVNYLIEYLNQHRHMINAFLQDMEEVVKEQNIKIKEIEHEFNTLKDQLINVFIPEEISDLMEEWFLNGKLAEIINKQIFDNKVDKDTLNDFHVNVVEYGAKGDGTDQTSALQDALNENDAIFIPKGEYLFNELLINRSNQSIKIADGVKFKSPEDTMDVNAGAITIKGAGIRFSTTLMNDTREMENVVYVQSTDGFLVNDFVKIEQTDPTGTSLAAHKQKYISTIARVKAVDPVKQSITLIEAIPHAFQVRNQAKISKIDVIQNISIISDTKTPFDKMFTESYSNHISVDYAYNVTIKGFEFFNGGGKGIRLSNVHTYDVQDCLYRNPTKTTSGQGYGFQAENGACYGYISNFNSYNCRHTIDFAKGAHHCLVENCYAFGGGFNGHGMNTKYITFKHCYAYGCGFGIGNDTFMSDELYIFEDCHVYNHAIAFSVSNQSSRTKIINCSARKTTTSILLLQDCYDIDIINFETDDCNNGIDIRLSHDIRIDGYFVNDFGNKGMLVRGKCNNVRIKNASIRDAKSVEGGIEGIALMDCSNIQFVDTVMRGDMRRAFTFSQDVYDVIIDRPDIQVNSAPIVIDYNNTNENVTKANLTIKNAINIKSSGTGVYSFKGGINIMSSNIDGILIEETTQDVNIINNTIKKSLSVRSTSNVSVLNNVIDGTFNVPENNNTNVIVNSNRVK